MEYRLRSNGEILYHNQLEVMYPNFTIPQILDNIHLEYLGLDRILDSAAPATGLFQSAVKDGIIQNETSNWVYNWRIEDWSPAHIAQYMQSSAVLKWNQIKAERDRRTTGGFHVGLKWFHSDQASRVQHLGLKDKARDILSGGGTMTDPIKILGQQIYWKTMDSSFLPLVVQHAFDIINAAANLDAMLFIAAEQHKAAMINSVNPMAYDFSSGWPQAFEDLPN